MFIDVFQIEIISRNVINIEKKTLKASTII